jgi:endonuclease/exonuclease/phosphatase (EEP) superfamily protein YafD
MRPGLRAAIRVAVGTVVAAVTLLIVAQHAIRSDNAWLEISRYLPYFALLVPSLAALVASFWLGRAWVVAGTVNLALLLTLGMGLQWNTGDTGTERVRVMTYNIKLTSTPLPLDRVQALAQEVARHDPDILVMQDANGLRLARGGAASTQGPVFGLPNVYAMGQYVVASRFALHDCSAGPTGYGGENPQYVYCQVDARGIALSLVTTHFQSPREGLNAARREGLEGADDWEGNYAVRLAQARALTHDLAASRGPLVVAGDLNAPESSPVVRALLAVGLRDAFSSAGRGYGYTHGHSLRPRHDFLRIDHILVSPQIGVMDSFVGRSNASDHRPVIADLVLRP